MPATKRLDSSAYAHFDTALRGVWIASVAAGPDETKIAHVALCSKADAWRVALIRRVAAPSLVQLWLDRELTSRQLLRICLDAPYFDPDDERAQLELASRHSHRAKRELESA